MERERGKKEKEREERGGREKVSVVGGGGGGSGGSKRRVRRIAKKLVSPRAVRGRGQVLGGKRGYFHCPALVSP